MSSSWAGDYGREVAVRHERHFGERVVPCFAERPRGPYEAFLRAVGERPRALALVVGAARLSYAELHERANRAAAGLVARGVEPGDRVAMLLSNRLEFVTTLLATLRIGAVTLPIGTRLQRPEVAYMVQHSGAKLLVHDADLGERLPARGESPELRHTIDAERLEQGGDVPAAHVAGEEAVAAILYTSGTTGKPKGAMLTGINLVHSMLNYRYAMRMGPADRTVMAVPASHVTGLTANIMLAWAAQCALVVMPEFKASTFIELAARERITHTVIVPAMYNLCLLQPDLVSFDLSAWRIGGYGGAPMAEATIAALRETLPRLELHNIYGTTETTGPVTMLPPRHAAERPDSVGFALPGSHIMVMDDAGREVEPGAPGELWIGGAMVSPGYWANTDATRNGFVGGYWRSGDVGSIDRSGFVRVFDRMKDMLNRGGYKIYSVEVENVLREHDAVVEAAIVGKHCPVLGERVHAFVCLKQGVPAGADALRRFCAERLADYKVPESFTLTTDALPRNANGKLLKRTLREQLEETLR